MTGAEQDAKPLYRYRFGSAEFDVARYELRVGGLDVEIQRLPLELLTLLLERAGEVLTKQELLDVVWHGRPTVENVLPNAIRKLRDALGDENATFVETLPRIGYRFTGPVERIAVGRALASRLDLKPGTVIAGRPNFQLESLLSTSPHSEVWVARHAKTKERRVYKFAPDGERLSELKREVTVYRVLSQNLAARNDVVRILDWNFAAAPFFLECEYGGENLFAWAEHTGALTGLSLSERIDLFLQIADVVGAAHGIGVLHKDLKPTNVLIECQDARRQIRLTDFGSAKLLDPDRVDALGITRLGLTLTVNVSADSTTGTPLYMAPELIAGQVPTVQSDLYALGLMLYQMVCGDLKRPMAPGWESAIPDELVREDIAAATDGSLARRLTSVTELAERLRNREHRRQERELTRDAQRRALLAEQTLQRSRTRRPWLIAAIVTLTLGLLGTTWFYWQSQRARHELAAQNDVLAAVQQFMLEDFIHMADPKIAGHANVTVAEAARAAVPKIDQRFGERSPAVRAALHGALLQTFTELSDFNIAVSEGRAAVDAYEKTSPVDTKGLIHARLKLAYALADLSRYAEATKELDLAEQAINRVQLTGTAAQVELWTIRAAILDDFTDLSVAADYLERARSLAQALPDVPESTRNSIAFNLGSTLTLLDRLQEGEEVLRELVQHASKTMGPHAAYTLYCQINLAQNLANQRRLREAQALAEPVVTELDSLLGRDNQKTVMSRDVLASIYFRQRNFALAESLYREVAGQYAAMSGGGNTYAVGALINAATATQYQNKIATAERDFRQVLTTALASKKRSEPQLQEIYYHLADCLLEQSKTHEVESLLQKIKPEDINAVEIESDWPARIAYQFGRLRLLQGRNVDAAPYLKSAFDGIDESGEGRITKEKILALLKQAAPARQSVLGGNFARSTK